MAIGLLILRLAVGLSLVVHGVETLFGWFGVLGLEASGRGLEALGFQPGRQHALRAGLVEMSGGLLMAFGLLTPLAGTVVFSVMVVAGVSAHLRHGFFITHGGYEYTLVLGLAGLSIAFTGPGALSIDALLGSSVSGPLWGVAALVVGLAAAAVQLAQRHTTPVP